MQAEKELEFQERHWLLGGGGSQALKMQKDVAYKQRRNSEEGWEKNCSQSEWFIYTIHPRKLKHGTQKIG